MMKRSFLTSVRTGILAAGCAVVAGAGMVACSKTDLSNGGGNQAVSLLSASNLSDKSGIGVALSGSYLVNNAIGYRGYTGYLSIYPGTAAVRSFDGTSGSSLAETQFTFDTSKYYSLFVAGANGTYRNMLVRDNYDSLSGADNKAYIRFVNAVPDSARPAVTITTLSGQTVVTDAAAAFTKISEFTGVGSDSIRITASNGGTIQTTRTIKVTAPKVYTILVTGFPGTTDTSKTVRISYIENGSLSTSQRSGARVAGLE